MLKRKKSLPWLQPGDAFPPLDDAWRAGDAAPGLLAAGGALDTETLTAAYSQGIFPWFSEGQPIMWWSPDPRMVLQTANFKLHRSLRKTILQFANCEKCEIRFDTDFRQVIESCAGVLRDGQAGTWIVPEMIEAYIALHREGYAHSVEIWVDGQLVGGLYCVNVGQMVFGESMFAGQTDASKIALAALVAFCRARQISMIDCQQNTGHLASLGAAEIDRKDFSVHLQKTVARRPPIWKFELVYWNEILKPLAQTLP